MLIRGLVICCHVMVGFTLELNHHDIHLSGIFVCGHPFSQEQVGTYSRRPFSFTAGKFTKKLAPVSPEMKLLIRETRHYTVKM